MSLQYIIDGYNVAKHPSTYLPKKMRDIRTALVEFIRLGRLCGSNKNKITIVFDGYPDSSFLGQPHEPHVTIIFSGEATADEKIKRLVENAANAKNIIVVSDDKEIQFIIKAIGAKSLGVEEFIGVKKKPAHHVTIDESLKFDLNYSQVEKINKELKGIWLK